MIYKENIFKCPRCGNPRIVEYNASFGCTICKDKDGKPLEFDKEDIVSIKDKSNILSVQEKLAFFKVFGSKSLDPEVNRRFLE